MGIATGTLGQCCPRGLRDRILRARHILSMLLAIDSGACTGWALFAKGLLAACGLGEQPDDVDSPWMYGCATFEKLKVVIECPRLRPRGEKNPNSILLVARNAGEWAGRYMGRAEVRYVTPNDWKGSTPKKIDHFRTLAKLSAIELDIYRKCSKGISATKRENILDAIGIGLWAVKR